MKKLLSLLSLVILATLTLVSCSDSETTRMTMGTGSTQGTYYAYGGVLAQHIKNKAGINVTVVSTDGSKANIQGIDAGSYHLGTVQADIMDYAWNGLRAFENDKIDSFRTVAGLYDESVQLVTTDPSIKSVADLKGKSVSIGAPGSGVYFNATDVLAAAGLTENDIEVQHLSNNDAAEALKDGKIVAAFYVASFPAPSITELCMTNDAYLVPIDGEIANKIIADNPFYSSVLVPANTYEGQAKDVNTICVKAALIVNADASEEDVYNLTAAIFDNAEEIAKENSKGEDLSLETATTGITVPFHKGAAKYFEEHGITVESK